jgi:peptidoglycan/xylan/chitin deacetylase (PgdA/CDA1 family)
MKTVCFTLDVEPDFAGLLVNDIYLGKNDLPKLEELVRKHKLKLTAFVTGKSIEENPDILESLRSMNAEIESHSYSHRVGRQLKMDDIEKGIETHEKLVGSAPIGYRAPQGIITQKELLFLENIGIKFDSSIFPTFFPGRFNRQHFPTSPFIIKGSNLIEIPFAVLPKIRLPIGLGYMQLLSLDAFKLFFKLVGLPELIVYDFHTYELGKLSSYGQLSTFGKFGYFRAQKTYADPFKVFERFVEYILSNGYQSRYMIDVYKEVRQNASVWEWNGD